MNKKVIIGLAAATLVVVVIAVGVVQGSRLKAALSVAKSATMNEEQVEAKNQENAQMQQEIRERYEIPEVQLSEELQAALADGSITLEEAAQQLISGGTAAPSPDGESDSQTAEASEPTQAPSESEPAQTQAPSESQPAQTQTPSESAQTPSESQPAPTQTLSESAQAPSESQPAPTQTPSESQPAQTQTPSESKPAQTQAPSESKPAPTQTPSESGETASLSGETEPDDGPTEKEKAAEAARKAQEETNARVQNLFTQLYVLRDSFSKQVDAIINECVDEFLALDPSQQTRTMKIRIVYGRMDKLSAMEAECDAQVEAIAAELDGIDPSLGEKARQQYKNEKELKKSSLIAQYGG